MLLPRGLASAQLLSAGADYTVVNDRIFDNWVPAPIGSSALHLAVIRGSYDIALLLLEHYVSAKVHACVRVHVCMCVLPIHSLPSGVRVCR